MTGHDTPEFQKIADGNTILLGQVGSGLHGVTTGDDDLDLMGVCIEPPEYVIGNAAFEQYLWRSQPEGVRSGAGDTDLIVYSLRKWARLAAQGNPTVLLLLFIPPQEIRHIDRFGRNLQAAPDRFLSRQVADRFAGYLVSQRDPLLGLKSKKHTSRPELVDKYGFDTKFAYHMVRLGIQGVELLTTGKITLPMPVDERNWLIDLRNGKHTLREALDAADALLEQLNYLKLHADLPEQPNRKRIDGWLVGVYNQHWDEKGLL